MIKREKIWIYDDLEFIKKGMDLSGLTYTSTPTPNDNQWSFANSEIHIKDSSIEKVGAFRHVIQGLSIGDVIEVSCELYSISGVKPMISIDADHPNLGICKTDNYQFPDLQWKQVSMSYVVQLSSNQFMINIGTFTKDIGEFKVRNIRIAVQSKSEQSYFSNTFIPAAGFVEVSNPFPSRVRKEGRIVVLTSVIKKADSSPMIANANVTLGVLPDIYRPLSGFVFPIDGTPTLDSKGGKAWIYEDGTLVAKPYADMNDIAISVTFMARE